jgi:hypothetical protein
MIAPPVFADVLAVWLIAGTVASALTVWLGRWSTR